MKKNKQICILILMLLLVQSLIVFGYAETPAGSDSINMAEFLSEDEYDNLNENDGEFKFYENHGERFDSKGNFTFLFSTSLTSSEFTLTNTWTTITCSSELVGIGGSNRTTYTVNLQRKNALGRWVSEGILDYVVGESQSGTITGLTKNATYRIVMETPKVASAGKDIKGEGKILYFEQ